jgi:hypothetical protein
MNSDKAEYVMSKLKELHSDPAYSVPGTLPSNVYIQGPRYKVTFDRIVTPSFKKELTPVSMVKDVKFIETLDDTKLTDQQIMDGLKRLGEPELSLRDILSDNCIKDLMADMDRDILNRINMNTPNKLLAVYHGRIDNHEVVVVVDSETESIIKVTSDKIFDKKKASVFEKAYFDSLTDLSNLSNLSEHFEWYAQKVMTALNRLHNPNPFSDPKFIGKSYLLEDETEYITRQNYMLEFFTYETIGTTVYP